MAEKCSALREKCGPAITPKAKAEEAPKRAGSVRTAFICAFSDSVAPPASRRRFYRDCLIGCNVVRLSGSLEPRQHRAREGTRYQSGGDANSRKLPGHDYVPRAAFDILRDDLSRRICIDEKRPGLAEATARLGIDKSRQDQAHARTVFRETHSERFGGFELTTPRDTQTDSVAVERFVAWLPLGPAIASAEARRASVARTG